MTEVTRWITPVMRTICAVHNTLGHSMGLPIQQPRYSLGHRCMRRSARNKAGGARGCLAGHMANVLRRSLYHVVP
jgi:hypothetical protein